MKLAALPILAIFRLLATWRRRNRFRAQLRADIEGGADFLRDIGIDVPGAQIEVARFFWEPIALTRQQIPSAEAVLRDEVEMGLRCCVLSRRTRGAPRTTRCAQADFGGLR